MCQACKGVEVKDVITGPVKEMTDVNLTCPGCLRENKMERFTVLNKKFETEVRKFASCPKCRMEYGHEFNMSKLEVTDAQAVHGV